MKIPISLEDLLSLAKLMPQSDVPIIDNIPEFIKHLKLKRGKRLIRDKVMHRAYSALSVAPSDFYQQLDKHFSKQSKKGAYYYHTNLRPLELLRKVDNLKKRLNEETKNT